MCRQCWESQSFLTPAWFAKDIWVTIVLTMAMSLPSILVPWSSLILVPVVLKSTCEKYQKSGQVMEKFWLQKLCPACPSALQAQGLSHVITLASRWLFGVPAWPFLFTALLLDPHLSLTLSLSDWITSRDGHVFFPLYPLHGRCGQKLRDGCSCEPPMDCLTGSVSMCLKKMREGRRQQIHYGQSKSSAPI
jgi:hypothetical protein